MTSRVRVSTRSLPLPFIPTLIGLRAFDLVSSPVWWEAATNIIYFPSFPVAVWHSCPMGYRSMADSRQKGPQLWLGHRQVGELQTLCPMYSTRPCCRVHAITRHTCVKLLGSLDPHCTEWVDEQHRPAGFESRLVSDLPPPLNPHYNHWPYVRSCLVGGSDKYLYTSPSGLSTREKELPAATYMLRRSSFHGLSISIAYIYIYIYIYMCVCVCVCVCVWV